MNATRIASLSAVLIAVALAAAGCANKRESDTVQTPARMTTPVAAAPAPMVQQPAAMMAEARPPAPMATPAADPVMTAPRPTMATAAPNSGMADNVMSDRAARVDRN